MTKSTTTKTYFSPYAELKIVMKGSYTKEVGGRIVTVPGKKIKFQNNTYTTSDPQEIAFLEDRPEFGDKFILREVPKSAGTDKFVKRQLEDLEEREARLKEREDKLKEKEAKLEGAVEDNNEEAVSLNNSREELNAYAESLEIENPQNFKNKQEVLDAIKLKTGDKNDNPAF